MKVHRSKKSREQQKKVNSFTVVNIAFVNFRISVMWSCQNNALSMQIAGFAKYNSSAFLSSWCRLKRKRLEIVGREMEKSVKLLDVVLYSCRVKIKNSSILLANI